MKQTAVEWFYDELKKLIKESELTDMKPSEFDARESKLINQAKKLEKQQQQQDTLEDIAQWVIEFRHTKNEFAKVSDFEMYHAIIDRVSKWQQQRSYSEEDMDNYAEYCTTHVLTSKTGHPYLSVKKWFEQFKKK